MSLDKNRTSRLSQIKSVMKIKFPTWTIPLALFAVCVAAFGLFIPTLGFYQDDWHPIYYAYSKGIPSLWEMFLYDTRPFAAWPMVIAFPILGFKPQNWHIFALLLRWLTVVTVWAFFRAIWPKNIREITWAAFLFAIYPLFKLQPLAVIYTLHWVAYLLFAFSMLTMVLAFRNPTRLWVFTTLSVLTAGIHLFTIEYFSGVELLRPVVLWILLSQQFVPIRKRIQKTLLWWSPYLLVLTTFVVWRAFFLELPVKEVNVPTVLFDLFSTPLQTAYRMFFLALQDFMAVMVSSWAQIFEPPLFDISRLTNSLVMLVIVVCIAVLYLFFTRLFPSGEETKERHWYKSALLLGVPATFLGLIPAWITEQGITINNPLWSDRLGLPSMLGAALVVIGLLEMLIQKKRYRTLIISVLIGLSIGWHLRYTNDFRWSWIEQSQFYQQLSWRVPHLEPHTAIMSEYELFGFMGDYPTSFAINALYQQEDSKFITTWFFGLRKDFGSRLEDLRNGTKLYHKKINSVFTGSSHDSIIIHYKPEDGQCLWVLRPEDQANRLLSDITRDVLIISNIDRIHKEALPGEHRFLDNFAGDPTAVWCYYYQKADLARQYEDWNRIVELWDKANQQNLSPRNGVELIPFVEGYAYTGKWEMSTDLTLQAKELTRQLSPMLCATWEQIEANTTPSVERENTIEEIREYLGCPGP